MKQANCLFGKTLIEQVSLEELARRIERVRAVGVGRKLWRIGRPIRPVKLKDILARTKE